MGIWLYYHVAFYSGHHLGLRCFAQDVPGTFERWQLGPSGNTVGPVGSVSPVILRDEVRKTWMLSEFHWIL